MGVLGEARANVEEIEAQSQQAVREGRSQVYGAIMGNLSHILAEPEFTGDVETALVHYMGEEAFTDDVATERYTSLVERIKGERDKRVPVMFIYSDHDELGDPYASHTAMMYVMRSRGVKFTSARTREEGVGMHTFAGQMVKDETTGEKSWQPNTATVTHSRLALNAATYIFGGDALRDEELSKGEPEVADEFVLQERHVADGHYGKGMPSDYTWNDSFVERFYSAPTVLVGWEAIEHTLMHIYDNAHAPMGSKFHEALKLQALFSVGADLVHELPERAPRLAQALKMAEAFQRTAGNLATQGE